MKLFTTKYKPSLAMIDNLDHSELHDQPTCRYMRLTDDGHIYFTRLRNNRFTNAKAEANNPDWLLDINYINDNEHTNLKHAQMFRYVIDHKNEFGCKFFVVIYRYSLNGEVMADISVIDLIVDDLENELMEIRLKS